MIQNLNQTKLPCRDKGHEMPLQERWSLSSTNQDAEFHISIHRCLSEVRARDKSYFAVSHRAFGVN